MKNPAPVEHPVHDLIRFRWSPRAFADKPVSDEDLRSLFEAARWAPSSNNEQPWAFVVATKREPEAYQKVLSTLVEFNQSWAKSAPVLGLAFAELAFAKNNAPNRNAFYDVGAAMAHLSAEATARGIRVHQMAGFDHKKADELFHAPAGWEAISAFVIGYEGDPNTLPDYLKERETAPRSRKPIAEFVKTGDWGKPAAFLKR